MPFVLWNELKVVSNYFWALASFFISPHRGTFSCQARESKTSTKCTTRIWVYRLNVMGKKQVLWSSRKGCRGRYCGLRGKRHRRLKTIAKWAALNRYCLGDHVKGEMDKGCDTCGGKRNVQTVFVGNLKENLPLGRRGCRQENNIKKYSCTKELESVDWINLTRERDKNPYLQEVSEPLVSVKLIVFFEWLSN